MVEIDVSNKAIKLSKATFLAMDRGWRNYKATHGGREYPKVHLNQTTKKGEYVTVAKFKEMRGRWIAFRKSQLAKGIYEPGTRLGRRPNYIWIVHKLPTQTATAPATIIKTINTYINPRYILSLKQKTLYFCALNVIEQLIFELYGIVTDQYELAKLAGTTTTGTGHTGFERAMEVKVIGLSHKCDVTYQTFSGLGSTSIERWRKLGEMVADPNIGIGLHLLYRLKWGHYIVPVYINLETKTVGFSDSLNEEDILYVSFATAESWIANTTGGQPSVIKATKIY